MKVDVLEARAPVFDFRRPLNGYGASISEEHLGWTLLAWL
jgi:hypothetical protein